MLVNLPSSWFIEQAGKYNSAMFISARLELHKAPEALWGFPLELLKPEVPNLKP